MVKLTKQQRRATRVGAVLGLVALLGMFAVLSTVDLTFAEILDPTGIPIEDSNVLYGLDEYAQLLNDPVLKSSNCPGLPLVQPFVNNDFSVNSTVGTGTSWNDSIYNPLCSSLPGGNEKHTILMQITLTAQAFLDLGAQAISVGWSADVGTGGNLTLGWGIVSPTATQTETVSSTAACPTSELLSQGVERFFALNADCVAFLASFPDWHIAWQLSGNNANFPGVFDDVEVDFSVYGEPIGETTGSIQSDIFGTFGASAVLATTYYLIALLTMLAAAMIWPTTTTKQLRDSVRRR